MCEVPNIPMNTYSNVSVGAGEGQSRYCLMWLAYITPGKLVP